jgi:hypothetical protein
VAAPDDETALETDGAAQSVSNGATTGPSAGRAAFPARRSGQHRPITFRLPLDDVGKAIGIVSLGEAIKVTIEP